MVLKWELAAGTLLDPPPTTILLAGPQADRDCHQSVIMIIWSPVIRGYNDLVRE